MQDFYGFCVWTERGFGRNSRSRSRLVNTAIQAFFLFADSVVIKQEIK